MDTTLAVEAFVIAGTPLACEYLGPHDEAHCVNCGARLTQVYITSRGPMGGDCLATITGTNATRANYRKAEQTLTRLADGARISLVGMDRTYSNASRSWPVRAYVPGKGWKPFAFANTEAERARWFIMLPALAERFNAEVRATEDFR